MEQLKHFSHEHSLILNEYHGIENVACYACYEPVIAGTSVYCCNYSADCGYFFLHKSCAELPEKIDYPMHPQHILVQSLDRKDRGCDVCRLKYNTYSCSECHFDVCLTCSFDQQRNFRHQGHNQHTFTFVPRLAFFLCNACGAEGGDFSYICNSCPFWMHKSCASAPADLKCKFHEHPLVLAYSVPNQYRTFLNRCSICNNTMNRNDWLYYCGNCRFFAHMKCSTSIDIDPVLMLSENEGDEADSDEHNLVHFPMSNELSLEAIIHQFIKASSLTDNTNTAPNHIDHWAHKEHPLILFDDELKRNNTSETMNRNDDQMLCDGCVRPILSSDLFYGCAQCSFFLHKYCVELLSKVEQSLHPEHELVIKKYRRPNFYIECNLCRRSCNGMFYFCKICKFYLDIRCALIPTTIKHEAHRHPLRQLKALITFCDGCHKFIPGTSFDCEVCDFQLGGCCTFMPSMVSHRWDPHPIPLVYPPVKDHPDMFYCEICEEEINPNRLFYHCRPCDQSFHARCLEPYYRYSNMKFGANDIKVENHHPHNLTFVGMEKHKAPPYICSNCGDDIPDGSPVLKCEPCHFRLCMKCEPTDDATLDSV